MAHSIEPGEVMVRDAYRGLPNLFEYTNGDGELCRFNCGQAAAATYLTFRGVFSPSEEKARDIMRQIEKEHPPNIMFGKFGTSRRRVQRICREHGHPLERIFGEEALRDQLNRDRPVVVMLGVPGPRILRINWPAGHWMVAYGYDSAHVYLSNWGRMTWDEFRPRWNGLVPRLIGMCNRGLAAVK